MAVHEGKGRNERRRRAGVPQPSGETLDPVEVVRRFNRFYTRRLGVLDDVWLRTGFSLTEARMLYELAHRDQATATELRGTLGLDAGYLSRLLRALQERGVVARRESKTDGRQSVLSLTRAGRAAFATLDAAARTEVRAMLDAVPAEAQRRVVGAMQAIQAELDDAPAAPAIPYLLRAHQPGDIGWVIHRQAVLYAREYGWDQRYEALIARILADFVDHFDPARERCWIAERDGAIVGSVFVVAHPDRAGVAKLRLLYVEPSARGLGIGRRLVQEVTRFARLAGYDTLTLWTNSVLVSARRIYEAEGYRLVHEEAHHSFGRDLVGQTWELALDET